MNKIFAVGIGPGDLQLLTPRAAEVLRSCSVVAGYPPYLELIAPLLEGKKLIPGGMRQEVERCTRALEAVLEGETVAVVSSGDAGVYGMAGLLLELTREERFASIEVEVIPGITAALSCAALVGAPFANDFALISLSDLMTPAEVIRKRLSAVASADMPVALYNPASRRRHDLLEFAVETFLRAGGPLPGALVSDAFRPSQRIEFFTLDRFPFDSVRMTTLVIVGNSQFELNRGKMFCRRGYREKYGVGQ
ncbi:MAG: Cobalt-precorrin-3B C(17)-methyltransferase [Lentisphaerae bacterium ADurb.Bin242]|nr:MAG: Cobalt-precorrin-3B C(17)-methyltransferase [Lentisphaerae bacterium ADurb.Bin242]